MHGVVMLPILLLGTGEGRDESFRQILAVTPVCAAHLDATVGEYDAVLPQVSDEKLLGLRRRLGSLVGHLALLGRIFEKDLERLSIVLFLMIAYFIILVKYTIR